MNAWTCTEGRPRLGAYLDGELGAADRARLDAHIAGCASCRSELATLEAQARTLRSIPMTPTAPELEELIAGTWQRIDETEQAAQPAPSPASADAWWQRLVDRLGNVRFATLAPVAAALCVMVIVGKMALDAPPVSFEAASNEAVSDEAISKKSEGQGPDERWRQSGADKEAASDAGAGKGADHRHLEEEIGERSAPVGPSAGRAEADAEPVPVGDLATEEFAVERKIDDASAKRAALPPRAESTREDGAPSGAAPATVGAKDDAASAGSVAQSAAKSVAPPALPVAESPSPRVEPAERVQSAPIELAEDDAPSPAQAPLRASSAKTESWYGGISSADNVAALHIDDPRQRLLDLRARTIGRGLQLSTATTRLRDADDANMEAETVAESADEARTATDGWVDQVPAEAQTLTANGLVEAHHHIVEGRPQQAVELLTPLVDDPATTAGIRAQARFALVVARAMSEPPTGEALAARLAALDAIAADPADRAVALEAQRWAADVAIAIAVFKGTDAACAAARARVESVLDRQHGDPRNQTLIERSSALDC